MPQISLAHAVARVRVLEGKLLKADHIQRLLQAPSLRDAEKLLDEFGWNTAEDIDALLAQRKVELCAFMRQVSPMEEITNAFLFQSDIRNAKLLVKGRELGLDAVPFASDTGFIPLKTMAKAIEQKDYLLLPDALADALKKLDLALAAQLDPGLIDTVLDKCWASEILRLSAGEKTAHAYFVALIDLTNLCSLLRGIRAKLERDKLLMQLLPGGSISQEELICQAAEPSKLVRLYESKPYAALLRPALEKALKQSDFAPLERVKDDYLFTLLKQKRMETVAIEPLLCYYVGYLRQMEMIRLVMAAKRNGFAPEAVQERLREMYG